MASEWFCKVLGKEVGPVGFPDMAEMVRSGTLKEDDQVRRRGTTQWIPAGEVIGLFRAAGEGPIQPAVPTLPAAKPEPVPKEPPGKDRPAAQPRRMRKRYALLGAGVVVAVVLLMALASLWRGRQTERFPEPQAGTPQAAGKPRPAGKPGPIKTMKNAPVTESARLQWDFREGLDRRNMALMTGGAGDAACRPTPEGIRCTIPPGDDQIKYCGVSLRFGLRGDFQITARYQLLSMPRGEPGCFPALKISICDVNEHWAQMVRQNLHDTGDIFNIFYKQPDAPHGSIHRVPTSVTAGTLSLRRTGTTLHYLATTDQSEELVELHSFDFPSDDVTRIHLAAQTGGSLTGVDMVWHDLQVEADAVLGLAEQGGRTGEQESGGTGKEADR